MNRTCDLQIGLFCGNLVMRFELSKKLLCAIQAIKVTLKIQFISVYKLLDFKITT